MQNHPLHTSRRSGGTRAPRYAAGIMLVVLLLLLLMVTGCKSVPIRKPEAPRVSVVDVDPQRLSLKGQQIEFTLRIENPNGFDLPVEAMEFVASFAGDEFASGSSTASVTVPANGEAELKVGVLAGFGKIVKRLQMMAKTRSLQLDYGVTGTVKLANWPRQLPFNVTGEIEPAAALTDSLKQLSSAAD